MHILLISYYFPPYNTIGAVRVGKFAHYLAESGDRVSVVTARTPALEQQDASVPLEIEPSRVKYTPWLDFNAAVRDTAGLLQRRRSGASAAQTSTGVMPSLDAMPRRLRAISKLYLSLTNVPDAFWGWQPYAMRAAGAIAREDRPDVVVASGPPFSAFQVAARLHRRLGIPWVADFRDFWTDKQHYPFLEWRRRLDLVLERRAVQTATGFVAVSAPMIDLLSARYPGLPCREIPNGFDPVDYTPHITPAPGLPLVLRYTGTLFYVGNNDPSTLFEALKLLGEDRRHVRVEFILRDFAPRVQEMARSAGVEDCVEVLPPVPYRQSLELQQRSDILALILPTGPTWDGVFTGKFFEYCGAGRPILAIAGERNVAAQAVRELGLGLASTDASQIAAWIRRRLQEKRNNSLAGLDPKRVRRFTRQAQTQKLAAFIHSCIG